MRAGAWTVALRCGVTGVDYLPICLDRSINQLQLAEGATLISIWLNMSSVSQGSGPTV